MNFPRSPALRALTLWLLLFGIFGSSPCSFAGNAAGKIPSAAGNPPVIDEQPIGRTASVSGHVALSVLAQGTAPLSFQWMKNGQPLVNDTNIFGATNSVLNIDPAGTNNSADYSVLITNTAGAVTSTVVSVTVNPVVLQLTVVPGAGGGLILRITGPIGDVYRIDGSSSPTGPFTFYTYLTNRSGSVQTFRPFSQAPPNYMQARFDHMLPVLYPPRAGEAPNSLRAYGKLNQVWRFEGSTDLLQWAPIITVTNTNGWYRFNDPPLQPPPIRFYRIAPP